LHFHISEIPEMWKGVSELGQHALKTTIGKMKTEGRPTRALILTVVDCPIRIGFQMEKKIFDTQIRPKSAPGAGRPKAGRSDRTDRWRFRAYPGLELLKAGGHTPGSQIVALHTAAGKTALWGDVRTLKNYSRSHSGRLERQIGGHLSCA